MNRTQTTPAPFPRTATGNRPIAALPRLRPPLRIAATLAALAALLFPVPPAEAEIGDLDADRVRGQSRLSDATALPIDATSFANPQGVAIDRTASPNRVYVSDSVYHRVLGWSDVDALASGAPADIVIGQPDFAAFGCNRRLAFDGVPLGASASSLCEPLGLAVDASGRLFVADAGNCRVLAYDDPFATDRVADAVFGQSSFTTSTCKGGGGTGLYRPADVDVDPAGNVFVADMLNCRVLEYDVPFAGGDSAADRVFGQTDFNGSQCSGVGHFYFPSSVALDPSGNLWVGSQSQVYEVDDALGPDREIDRRFGSLNCNDGGETASSTCGPTALAVDPVGKLYVADAGNNRVLGFDLPISVFQAARVFGQSDFGGSTTLLDDECNDGGPGAASLCLRRVLYYPQSDTYTYEEAAAVDVDSAGRLYVADGLNHRVLRYDAPSSTDSIADLVLGHAAMDDVRKPTYPIDDPRVVVSPNDHLLGVLDRARSRLVLYSSLGSYPDTPIAVIGQPDVNASGCNTGGIGASTLCHPSAATVDRYGNLWIADSGNDRVLEFDFPWIAYNPATRQYDVRAAANRVQGQPDFGSSGCAGGATGLCAPEGVAVDLHDTLFVSDTGNHRVVQNQNPFADRTFERVFGQATLAGAGCNAPGPGAGSLCDPRDVVVRSDDVLFVADRGNNRVLAFTDANSGDAQADVVLGQTSMGGTAAGGGAGGLDAPVGLGLDDGGNLYVADTGNHRTLEFDDPIAGDRAADRVFGQPDLSGTACNAGGVSGSSACGPVDVAVSAAYGDVVFVADGSNHRVLAYDSPFCRQDFQLTAANRRDRSVRSKPKTTTLKIKFDDPKTGGGDLLSFRGSLVLLEQDGGISGSDEPLLTLFTEGGTVYRERVPYMSNLRTTPNGGVWAVESLKGERDRGIDEFRLKEDFVIPPGFSTKPQFQKATWSGRSVGQDLGAFAATDAWFRLQFGSTCFTTEVDCKTAGTGRTCRPAR